MEDRQYSPHLYRSTPPICIAIRLPFVSQYFWENLGGCGHRDVPHCRAFLEAMCASNLKNAENNLARNDQENSIKRYSGTTSLWQRHALLWDGGVLYMWETRRAGTELGSTTGRLAQGTLLH